MSFFTEYAKCKIESAIAVIRPLGLYGLWCERAFAPFPDSAVFWDMSDKYGTAEKFLIKNDAEIRALIASLPEGVSRNEYFSMTPSERVAWVIKTYALQHREEYAPRVECVPSNFVLENAVLVASLLAAIALSFGNVF